MSARLPTPALLAARGFACDTGTHTGMLRSSLRFFPWIFEQKRDCSQSTTMFTLKFLVYLLSFISNISNTRDSVSSGYPNTEKRVENTTRSGVFLTKYEVFG